MIKNIITDMGNVLLKFDPDQYVGAFCKSEMSRKIIKKELFGSAEWALSDQGELTPSDRFEKIKDRVPPEYHGELKECNEKWHTLMTEVPGAKAFLQKARAAGYRIFVLSNATSEFYDYFPQRYDLKLFDGLVVSSDIRLLKPDPRIYGYTLEKFSLIPGECLFIDDIKENTEGAKKAGMQAHLFKNDFQKIL